MNRMLPRLVLPLAFVAAPFACGQTLYFSDGRTVPLTPAVRITGDTVVLPLAIEGGGTGEVTVPISKLTRVDWPKPEALTTAEAELAADKPADALRRVDALLPLQQSLRDVPGSWWGLATTLRASALASLGRDIDAEVELERLRRSPAGAAFVARTQLALASARFAASRDRQAEEQIGQINRQTIDPSTLAALYVLEARLLQKKGRHEDALLTFLRVPVLLPAETARIPAALLGAAECYLALGESARRSAALNAIVERFPDSPEAARARRLLSPGS